jgi:DNA-binding transcriptional LysR family regulator
MRHRHQNIPIEIFRTILAIAETGSLTKAGLKLGLSQPAVSSQIKRIELIVGGSVFQKTANGSQPTSLGKLVIANARKVIAANEQILAFGGASSGPSPVRVGLSSLLVRKFMSKLETHILRDVQVVSDNSPAIVDLMLEGKVDVACIFKNTNAKDVSSVVVETFDDQLIWARSRTFVLSPGSPIPIVTWSGDDWMATALTRQGLAYRIAYNGEDVDGKLSAVEAGLGIIALPEHLLPSSLVHAKEYYLPKIGSIQCLLCVRPNFLSERISEIRDVIRETFSTSGQSVVT